MGVHTYQLVRSTAQRAFLCFRLICRRGSTYPEQQFCSVIRGRNSPRKHRPRIFPIYRDAGRIPIAIISRLKTSHGGESRPPVADVKQRVICCPKDCGWK